MIPLDGVANRLERRVQFAGGLPAIGGALGEAAHDHRFERRRDAGATLRHRIRRFGHVRGEHLLRRGTDERRPAGEQLVRHRADGVDVAAMIDVRIGGGLLRRHVRRRADRDAERGHGAAAGRFAHRLGHAEVGHQRVAPGEHHVVGLDVAMHHAVLVRVGERIDHFGDQPHRFVHRQLAFAGQPLAKRLARHVRHDVVEEAVGVAGVEQRQDVRVLQLRGDLDFAEEARRPQRGGEILAQHLDRHLAMMLEVLGEIDRRHPALAELALDRDSGRPGGRQAFCGHRTGVEIGAASPRCSIHR